MDRFAAGRASINSYTQIPRAASVPDVQQQEMAKNLPQENVYENVSENGQSKSFDELKTFYLSGCANDFRAIKNDFKTIASSCKKNEPSHDVGSSKENSKKNRFRNIYPYDRARVTTLSNERYINASYIEGYTSSRRYIATQGPKTNTIDDFWEMVWNENSSIIVMLCKCVENGKSKCASYWPQSGSSSTHQHLTVKGKSEEKFGGITKRTFCMDNLEEQGQRKVVQFHFTSWPDHGIPLTTSEMVQLRKMVEKEHEEASKRGPIIIHCSAGAGRTGTYIAIDNLTEEMNDTGKVDVINAVVSMRKNRKDMVQNANQYVFVYKILLENICLGDTELPAKLIPQILENKDWNDCVKEEFELFFCLFPEGAITQEENIYQNSSLQVLSKNVNRVSVGRFDDTTVAMNAHIIEDDRYPGKFIASSSPDVGREEDFIAMILQRNAKIVVCLEAQESDAFAPYKRKDGDEFEMGAYAVTVVHITDFNAYKLMNLQVFRTLDKEIVGGFTLVDLSSWTDTYSPPHANYLAEVVNKVKISMESNEFSSAVVYCRDGCSRTGLFLVFANLMEQLKSTSNNFVDVFRTVKDLRDLRPGAIDMLSLYEQCYRTINEFITTNSD